MGTTLTGTKPKDTYDSLIKVTDNGPLSGTAKYLSDGLGNDSALAVSTARVGVGTNAPSFPFHVLGSAGTIARITDGTSHIDLYSGSGLSEISAATTMLLSTSGSERMRITSTGNVGIGTSAPTSKLQVAGTGKFVSSSATIDGSNGITINKGDNSYHNGIFFEAASVSDVYFGRTTGASDDLVFKRATGGVEVARIQMNNGGISFNGDTAAANALDDYEEGTWTMGVSFGGASVGVAYSNNTGTYTKIGRQVTVNGRLDLGSKGSSTGAALLTGLPFTIANTTGNWSAASLRFNLVTFANQMQAFGVINTTTLAFTETTEAGVSSDLTDADFSNTTDIMFSFTYFV